MSKGKLIKVCGECANYDWKKHRCKLGCNEGEPQEPFFTDCPLPTANVTEWISVDERLPEESACYLVNIINHFGIDFVTFTYYTKCYGWGVPDVTHWMPLPEPPMMKGGAE